MSVSIHTGRVSLVVFVIIFAIYCNGIFNTFTFDDHLAIVNNRDTDPTTSLYSLFRNDIWGKYILKPDSHRSYRPLIILTFKLLRRIYDHPAFLRLINIVMHGIVTVLVYMLSELVTGVSDVAMGSALLFATHPVHVESVTAVVNMAEPVHAIFYILAFMIYYGQRRRNMAEMSMSWSRGLTWLLCVFVSILCKETGLTVIGIIVADIILYTIKRILLGKAMVTQRNMVWFGLSVSVIGIYVVFRMYLLGQLFSGGDSTVMNSVYLESSQLIRKAENPFSFLSGTEKALSLMYLHFRYIYVLLLPIQLCPEYAFDCIQSLSTIFDIRFLYVGLTYGIVLVLGLWSIYQAVFVDTIWKGGYKHPSSKQGKAKDDDGDKSQKDDKMVDEDIVVKIELKKDAWMYGCLWMIVPFIPASGIFLKLGTLLAERLLYVPSLGYCLLLSMIYFSVSQSYKEEKDVTRTRTGVSWLYWSLVLLTCVVYGLKTCEQNTVWQNDSTLFVESLKVCPRSAKLHLQVAKLYINSGRYDQGRYHAQKAHKIDPDFCDVDHQFALLALLDDKDVQKGTSYLVKNLKCTFTGKQSLEMLQQLWTHEIQQMPTNYHLVYNQGVHAENGGLSVFAAKKFIDATSVAYNQGQLLHALKLLCRAEKAMEEWLTSGENSEESQGIYIIKAFEMLNQLHLWGGNLRVNILDMIEKQITGDNNSYNTLQSSLVQYFRVQESVSPPTAIDKDMDMDEDRFVTTLEQAMQHFFQTLDIHSQAMEIAERYVLKNSIPNKKNPLMGAFSDDGDNSNIEEGTIPIEYRQNANDLLQYLGFNQNHSTIAFQQAYTHLIANMERYAEEEKVLRTAYPSSDSIAKHLHRMDTANGAFSVDLRKNYYLKCQSYRMPTLIGISHLFSYFDQDFIRRQLPANYDIKNAQWLSVQYWRYVGRVQFSIHNFESAAKYFLHSMELSKKDNMYAADQDIHACLTYYYYAQSVAMLEQKDIKITYSIIQAFKKLQQCSSMLFRMYYKTTNPRLLERIQEKEQLHLELHTLYSAVSHSREIMNLLAQEDI